MAAKSSTGSSKGKTGAKKTTGKKTTRSNASGAQSRKKTASTASRKSSAGSRTRQVPAPEKKNEYVDYALYVEIVVWCILAFSILVLISLMGLGGAFGKAIASFCFGLCGVMAWVLPFALFFMTAFLISNSGSRLAKIKSAAVTGLFIVLCAFMQLVLVGSTGGVTVGEYYESGVQFHTGGGVIGGLVAGLFTSTIGTVGAFLILIVLFIILSILATQRSFMGFVKKQSRSMMNRASDNRERRREWHEQERERRSRQQLALPEPEDDEPTDAISADSFSILPKEPRMNRRVSGVTTDTRLGAPQAKGKKKKSAELEEILAPITPDNLGMSSLSAGTAAAAKTETSVSAAPASVPAVPAAAAAPEAAPVRQTARKGRLVPEITFEDDTDTEDDVIINPEPGAMKELRSEREKAQAKPQPKQEFSFTVNPSPYMSGEQDVPPAQEPEDEPDYDLYDEFIEEEEAQPVSAPAPKAPAHAAAATAARPAATATATVAAAAASGTSTAAAFEAQSKTEAASAEYDAYDEDDFEDAPAEGAEESGKHHKAPKQSAEEIEEGIKSVQEEIEAKAAPEPPVYHFPPLSLLNKPSGSKGQMTQEQLYETARKLSEVFQTFGVDVKITNVTCGPSVTRYELQPAMGVKVSKIVSLQDDIKLNLAAADIRIEAPIPGKSAVGIEVPNKVVTGVLLRELLESPEFTGHPSKLAYAVGKDIGGNTIVSDIAKMPHLLIAGATGSGKSVFINTMIMSILYKATPEEVKLILIDPKVVELSVYNGIPHLYIPVVTNPKKASDALNWAVVEMNNRYQLFSDAQVRDIKSYNKKIDSLGDIPDKPQKMPQIVIIVDELADLMMVASGDVQDAIMHLTQLARAAGIHLIIATQRPSVDVITGVIKSNLPSRIAFMVSSGVDSRTILDTTGAENLLGNGDMLFAPQNLKQAVRVQGAFVSDEEVGAIVDYLKENNSGDYSAAQAARLESVEKTSSSAGGDGDVDELFADAGKFLIDKDKASIGMLQRRFKIGFNRAARIMDQLSDAGVVGPEEGTKPRKIVMSEEQFENYLEQN